MQQNSQIHMIFSNYPSRPSKNLLFYTFQYLKTMKKTFLFPFLAILILFLSSCTKNDDGDTSKPKSELIVSSPWKFSKATVLGIDASSYFDACQKDNIATLKADGTGTLDEGPTKCDSGSPQSVSFTWALTNNETTLQVSTVLFSGGSNDFIVESISSTTLVLSQVLTISGISQRVVFTFVH